MVNELGQYLWMLICMVIMVGLCITGVIGYNKKKGK